MASISDLLTQNDGPAVEIANRQGVSPVVLVCEHASNRLPECLGNLGLDDALLQSHIAWDPGAFGLATALSKNLDSPLVSARYSRLVYDVNRPPDSPEAMREKSEDNPVPGNVDLSDGERTRRIASVYDPFHQALSDLLDERGHRPSVVITVHSFTPVYFGKARQTELGVLHDDDSRLADRLIELAPVHTSLKADRNEPYGPEDGVTHTLKRHAETRGHLNAMLEIRNDLIASPVQQEAIARDIGALIEGALCELEKSDAA